MSNYLSLILFTPLAGALLLLFVNKQNENAIRWIANVVAFVAGEGASYLAATTIFADGGIMHSSPGL